MKAYVWHNSQFAAYVFYVHTNTKIEANQIEAIKVQRYRTVTACVDQRGWWLPKMQRFHQYSQDL